MAASLPGLDAFLTALRFEGFPVGPQEIVRLQHVFSQSPKLDRHQLRELLACLFVKHPDQQNRFDALFEDWYALADRALALPMAEPLAAAEPESPLPLTQAPPTRPVTADISEPPSPPILPDETPKSSPWGIGASVLGIALILSLGYGLWPSEPLSVPPVATQPPDAPVTAVRQATAGQPANHYWTWVPEIESIDAPRFNPAWSALALALLSLTSGAFLGWRYDRRQDIPPFDSPPKPGPLWWPLPEPAFTGAQMLQRDELREAVWRVERFVSEDLTPRLDIDRTVTATAHAGGTPEIHFQPATYPREVWLWRDEMMQDAVVERLLDDIERSLTRAGLPVRCGSFMDTPVWVRWQNGQEFSPLALEGHRLSALVLIVTDGYGMQLASSSTLEQSALDNLLRAFGEWPRLALVDISGGAYGLADQAEAMGLTCIPPEAIPAFLGAGPLRTVTAQHADDPLLGDLRIWAAAAALSPEPVTDETALDLRDRLALHNLSPWTLRDLSRMTDGFGGGVDWSPQRRTALLNWLTLCSCRQGKVEPGSPLDRTLDYWLARYRDEDVERQAFESVLLPWSQTPVAQRRQMDIAFLDLWRQPERAAKALYRLSSNLGEEIRKRFAMLVARDRQGAEPLQVVLPWHLSDRPSHVRWMLARMGLGTGESDATRQLKPPAALGLAWGMCGGLTLASLGWLAWLLTAGDVPVMQPKLPEAMQRVVVWEPQRSGLDTYNLVFGTPKRLQLRSSVPAHSTVQVRWKWTPQANIERLGESERWHAGERPQPIRACAENWPRRSLVAIEAEPSHAGARQLATQLLDLRSADVVLLGVDWQQQLGQVILSGGRTAGDQLGEHSVILTPHREAFYNREKLVNHPVGKDSPWDKLRFSRYPRFVQENNGTTCAKTSISALTSGLMTSKHVCLTRQAPYPRSATWCGSYAKTSRAVSLKRCSTMLTHRSTTERRPLVPSVSGASRLALP